MNESELYKATKERALFGAYLFHGAEELTKSEAVERIRALLEPDVRDLNLETLTNPAPSELLQSCDRLPFFDLQRLIIVKDWGTELADAVADRLEELAEGVILLFVRRGEEKRNSKLYRSLDARNRVVNFEALTFERAVSMVTREAALRRVELPRPVANKLVTMVGLDAYRLRNECSKAADYVGRGNTISEQSLNAAVTPSPEYDVFVMLNRLLSGNKRAGLRLLKGMLNQGEPPLSIAYFLEGRLRLMLHAKELQKAGVSEAEAVKRLGGSPYAAKMAYQNAKTQDEGKLKAAVIALAEVDLKLKQGLQREEDSLALAVLRCF
ncbi:MAG: DNA polymerase III subunit delta [Clostridia bacterium]|nr:DNA polymerase III subunit delta [Clostridia bacterium]